MVAGGYMALGPTIKIGCGQFVVEYMFPRVPAFSPPLKTKEVTIAHCVKKVLTIDF